MNYIIYDKLNPMLEAYLLLRNIINEEDPILQKEKLSKDHTLAAEDLAILLEEPCHIYASIKESLSDNLERLTFFFKHWENPNISLASILFTSTLDSSFEDMTAKLRTYAPKERFEFLRDCVLGILYDLHAENEVEKNNIQNETDLFSCIESEMGLSYEHKYYLILLYYHFDKLLEELHSILLKTLTLLNPFLDNMQNALAPFVGYLQENLHVHGLTFFKQEFDITLDSDNLKIYPTFNGFNKLILENFCGISAYDHMFLGIYLFELIHLRNASLMDEKNLTPFLKVIADPSKLEILKLLKTEKLYASQLAEKLQISNATISHHMSALLSLELVTFEKEQTKIFFSLKQEKIHSYLTLLQRVFK